MTRLNVLITILCVSAIALSGSILLSSCEKTQATAEVAVPVDVGSSVVQAAPTPAEGQ